MKEQLNCPNCGMPITGTQCEYCGTLFYDFATLDLDKPTYVRIRRGDDILVFKARVNEFSVKYEPQFATFYANDKPAMTVRANEDITINILMNAYPDDRGVCIEKRQQEKKKQAEVDDMSICEFMWKTNPGYY